ncbi:MAG: hypothetical protein JXB20_05185 [Bacilli bacterium]|nr:hypothetical protein [Bacilli bacterium]
MSGIKYKRILIPNKNPQRHFGVDFFADVFTGSFPGRKYYAAPIDIDQTFSDDLPKPKTDIMFLFKQEIAQKPEGSIIGFCRNPDPYDQRIERKELMREFLKLVLEHNMGVYVETTSDLIYDDLDLLKTIQAKQVAVIAVPIGFSNDAVGNKIESYEPSFNTKIRFIHKLANEGLTVGVIIKPVIPFINDTEANLKEILRRSHEAGARFVFPTFGIHVHDEQRVHFHNLVDNEFPGLKNIYMDTYGMKQILVSGNSVKLKKAFVFEAKRLKIAFGMKDTIKSIKPNTETQMKLF